MHEILSLLNDGVPNITTRILGNHLQDNTTYVSGILELGNGSIILGVVKGSLNAIIEITIICGMCEQ